MGIGDQNQLFLVMSQPLQQFRHIGSDGDPVTDIFFHLLDVQLQFAGPEVDTVPVQLTVHGAVLVTEHRPGRLGADADFGTVGGGHQLFPEIVVEVQIEQRAVHVKHDGIDFCPVDHGVNFF